MAAREKLHYQCQECGAATAKWAGQCPDCGAWNSLSETRLNLGRPGGAGGYSGGAGTAAAPVDMAAVEMVAEQRLNVVSPELARVLGGGLVPGSVVLIGGDPGIGKSTLLLQTLCQVAARQTRVLYITGEESLSQVKLRAQRLGMASEPVRLLAETRVETILATAQQERPDILVVDSVQTVFTEAVQSAPGSVGQVRESAAQLVRYAKLSGTAVFLVGHVTKEGTLAGPRVLEHMVDTVLYFESDQGSRYRVIRAIKNRFGAVNELGVFAMTDAGLKEVGNPSAIFLSRHDSPVSGSMIMVTREGSRPMLVEAQALVDESQLGNPRRVTLGLEQGRLSMLLAVLHRHGGIVTSDQDVFVNVVGGVRISETGADLPILLAVLSSLRDRPLPQDMVAFGEVGLAGEIRPVQSGEERLQEAAKHGFKTAIVPSANAPRKPIKGLRVIAAGRLQEAVAAAGDV